MKAARLFAYNEAPRVVNVPDPEIVGNLVGTYNDLAELMELNRQGKVRIAAQRFPLEEVGDVLHDLEAGRIEGRAVLVPSAAPGTVLDMATVAEPVAAGIR